MDSVDKKDFDELKRLHDALELSLVRLAGRVVELEKSLPGLKKHVSFRNGDMILKGVKLE